MVERIVYNAVKSALNPMPLGAVCTTGKQKRAKTGGEYGQNGEWYEGGQFIATTDAPKKFREQIIKKASGREQISPREYVVPEAGQVPIFARMAGTIMDHRDGSLNWKYINYQEYDQETIDEFEAAAQAWKDGEKFVSVYDFPRIANYADAARLVASGESVPGALLEKMPADVRASLVQV
jgi:hypothetical protein